MEIFRESDNSISTRYTEHGQRVLLSPLSIESRAGKVFEIEDIEKAVAALNDCGIIYGEGKGPDPDSRVFGDTAPTALPTKIRNSVLGAAPNRVKSQFERLTVVDALNVTHALRNFKCETLTLDGTTFQAITAEFKALSVQMRDYLEKRDRVAFALRALSETTKPSCYQIKHLITWDLHPTSDVE